MLLTRKEINQAIWNGYRELTEAKGLNFDDIEAREPDGEWDWSAYPERPVYGEPDLDFYNRCIAKAQHAKILEAVDGARLRLNRGGILSDVEVEYYNRGAEAQLQAIKKAIEPPVTVEQAIKEKLNG